MTRLHRMAEADLVLEDTFEDDSNGWGEFDDGAVISAAHVTDAGQLAAAAPERELAQPESAVVQRNDREGI